MTPSKRRLAAVWFADIVGYTSLSSRDEEAALAVIDLFQRDSEETISAHGGRLVHFIGDAVLADFQSTEAAVRAALDLQDQFKRNSRELGTPSSLRIGVHVGDVNATPAGDLFGDGVNTASRLTEQVAAPGQVVVSQDVWRHLKPRSGFHFSTLGQHRLPGIGTDVWAFQVRRESAGALDRPAELFLPDSPFGRRVRALLASTLVYGVLAFVVLVLGGRVRAALGLPGWTLQVAALLLAIGLVVIAGTSWVQSRPAWQRSVRSQARPWQLDLQEVGSDLAQRRFPELTWPRAIMGGVFAFSLLVVAGWFYVLIVTRPSGILQPREAYAAPGPGLAVLPFEVEGQPDDLWSEGMVDLLAMTMDGAGGLRVIDPRVVVSRWASANPAAGLESRLELGRQAGASFLLLGTVRSTADRLNIVASVYATTDGTELGRTEVSGSSDQLPSLVDELSARIVAMGFAPNEKISSSRRLRDLSTGSPEALRAYLAGEQFFRQSRWHEADVEFRRAVSADPEFALALYRLAMTEAWSRVPHVPVANEWGDRAAAFTAGLPERDSVLILAYTQLSQASPAALATLEAFTHRYPDDVDGWFLLGDADYHLNRSSPPADRRFRQAFREAIRLDRGFGPAYLHLIDDAVTRGDTAAARQTLAEFRQADPGNPLLTGFDWAYALSRTAPGQSESVNPTSTSTATLAVEAPTEARQRDPDPPTDRIPEAAARRIDLARRAVQHERSVATAGSPETEQGRRWEERARQAELAADWAGMIESLARAEEAYRRARPAEPNQTSAAATPPPTPAPPSEAVVEPEARPPPAAVAELVLVQVKRAIEEEDVGSLRRVWPGLSSEGASNWRQLFAQATGLRADFVVQGVEPHDGERMTVRVGWTYSYQSAGTRGRQTQSSSQTLTLQKQGASWVIASSSE